MEPILQYWLTAGLNQGRVNPTHPGMNEILSDSHFRWLLVEFHFQLAKDRYISERVKPVITLLLYNNL